MKDTGRITGPSDEPNPFLEPVPGRDYGGRTESTPPTATVGQYAATADEGERAKRRRAEVARVVEEEFYPKYPALRPERIEDVAATEKEYGGVLTSRPNVAKDLRKQVLDAKRAALAFAAASILGQRPDGFTLDKQAPEVLRQNRRQAWSYLIENWQVLEMPQGIWSLDDQTLSKYGGIKRRELTDLGPRHAGLRHLPAVLATLVADMVHSERTPALDIRSLNRKRETQGALLDGELQRLRAADRRQGTFLATARRQNMTSYEQEALHEYYRRQDIEQARLVRDHAERVVAGAARIRYGSNESSHRLLEVLAECLVAEAHDFMGPRTPSHVNDTLAMRMADAAHKCGMRSARELPEPARRIYLECVDHTQRMSYRPNSISAWLGIGALATDH